MTGAELSAKVMAYLEDRNCYVTNIIASSKAGTSDLIACINGRYVALEIKGKGDTLKPLQAQKLKSVIAAGGIGMEVRSINDAILAYNLAQTGQPCPPINAQLKQFEL